MGITALSIPVSVRLWKAIGIARKVRGMTVRSNSLQHKNNKLADFMDIKTDSSKMVKLMCASMYRKYT